MWQNWSSISFQLHWKHCALIASLFLSWFPLHSNSTGGSWVLEFWGSHTKSSGLEEEGGKLRAGPRVPRGLYQCDDCFFVQHIQDESTLNKNLIFRRQDKRHCSSSISVSSSLSCFCITLFVLFMAYFWQSLHIGRDPKEKTHWSQKGKFTECPASQWQESLWRFTSSSLLNNAASRTRLSDSRDDSFESNVTLVKYFIPRGEKVRTRTHKMSLNPTRHQWGTFLRRNKTKSVSRERESLPHCDFQESTVACSKLWH